MSGFARRNACPSLSDPMPTGDGLLVRLVLDDPHTTPTQLVAVLESAQKHGNGQVEITSRGNLQIRGLTVASAATFAAEIDALDLPNGSLPITVGVLAGIDRDEIANPLPIANTIRQAISPILRGKLAPKTSIVIDGDGQLPIDGVIADIRLSAKRAGHAVRWQVSVGGNAVTAKPVCMIDEARVVPTVVELLKRIAEKGHRARGRDLNADDLSSLGLTSGCEKLKTVSLRRTIPVGIFTLAGGSVALGLGLTFGAVDAGKLVDLMNSAGAISARSVRLAPGRALIFPGLDRFMVSELRQVAQKLGFVTQNDDPRLAISACMGATGCSSGQFDTTKLATEICDTAGPLLDGSFTLHISGCPKRCADVAGPCLTVLGQDGRLQFLSETGGADKTVTAARAEELVQLLQRISDSCISQRCDGETALSYLQRMEGEILAPEKAGAH